MKGYCKKCERLVDETEQRDGYCFDCYGHIFDSMREAYFKASNLLELVLYKVDSLTAEFNTVNTILNDMKGLFQKGWGVPK